MGCNASIDVVVPVPEASLTSLVTATAAATYMRLQGANADVAPVLEDGAPMSAYLPDLNISIVARERHLAPDISAEEIANAYRLNNFETRFLQPFCRDLLLDSGRPTRTELERYFDSLQQLVLPAKAEQRLCQGLESGPAQERFFDDARSLVDFIFDVIKRRLVQDPSNRDALCELMGGLPSK